MSVACAEIPPNFTYVLIPWNHELPLKECTLSSLQDDQLREDIATYFRTSATLSTTQEKEAFEHILKSAKSPKEKLAVQELVSGRESSFEIVPVTMPNRANGFIGSSLYIDEVGRFKELPLNDRASKFAQRDIRGDAFLVRNYDDPCSETWSRVPTSASDAEILITTTSEGANSLGTPAMSMLPAGSTNNAISESRALTQQDVETAQRKKIEGNELFSEGKYEEARTLYVEGLAALEGRDDFLDEEIRRTPSGVLPTLRQALLLNRGQCSLRRKEFRDSLEASRAILHMNIQHVKAQYMYASSLFGLSEFEACKEVIRTFQDTILPTMDPSKQAEYKAYFEQLAVDVDAKQAEYHRKQKQMFSGMFA